MSLTAKRIRLNTRQQQVVIMLAQGLTRKEVAHKQTVSLRVIDHVLEVLLQQFDCLNTVQLVATCVEHKLIELPAKHAQVLPARKIKAIFIGPPPATNGRGFYPFMEYLLTIEANGHINITHELFPHQQKQYKDMEEFLQNWDDIRNL